MTLPHPNEFCAKHQIWRLAGEECPHCAVEPRALVATYCVTHGMHDGTTCPACQRNDVRVLRGLVDDQRSDHEALRARVAGLERRLREVETILLQLTERP